MSGLEPFLERAAQNEVLFRSVNEQIEKLGRDSDQQHLQFVCECSNGACTEQIQLTLAEYEEVRSGSRWFAILPGHLTEQIEHVVRANNRYLIVEKDTLEASKIADVSDPRD